MGVQQNERTERLPSAGNSATAKQARSRVSARPGLRSALGLALRRLGRARGLLALLCLGMLVADVLICTVPLYSTLMANVQLRNALNSADPLNRNVEIQFTVPSGSESARQDSQQEVEAIQNRELKTFTAPARSVFVNSREFLLINAGMYQYDPATAAVTLPPEAQLEAFDYSAAAPHMHMIAGTVPSATSAGAVPEVIVTEEMAKQTGIAVGDTVAVASFGDVKHPISAKVVGIWEPKDAGDPYWNGFSFEAIKPMGPLAEQDIYPVLFTYNSFFAAMALHPDLPITEHFISYTQPTLITTDNTAATITAVQNARTSTRTVSRSFSAVFQSGLDQILVSVQRQEALLTLPLYIVAAQVVLLALFFVTAMAGLLVDAQGPDIAILKSRGVSRFQLLGAFGVQGALLAILALIASPVLAVFLSLQLAQRLLPAATIRETGVSLDGLLRASHPSDIIAPAIAGALLGVAAVVFGALRASRLDVLAFRREAGRAAHQPFWRRYYLDLALVAVCAIGYLELGQFGTTTVRVNLGQQANSPLLLLTPALMLIAGALLVLRVAPLGTHLGARLAARGRGLVSLLAFSNAERYPARYSRILLLLVLTVGLGIFALNFDASLAQNATDRATYMVGSDIQVMDNSAVSMQDSVTRQQALGKIAGVTGTTPIYRDYVNLNSQNLQLLGVDPNSFERVSGALAWRSDYADQPLDALMRHMRAHVGGNGGAAGAVWAIVSEATAEQASLKVGDVFPLDMTVRTGPVTVNFVVGDIVSYFPTLYPDSSPAGFVVADLSDLATLIAAGSTDPSYAAGPNEFWLRTTSNEQQDAAIVNQLNSQQNALDIQHVLSRDTLLMAAQVNPVSAGMRGLLLVGALTAGLLALVGSVVQSVVSARQRTSQFALLRTLGLGRGQVTRILLGEQVIVYFFGVIGGTLLGLILSTATLPFLQFSDNTINPTQIGVPPYLLSLNPLTLAAFYAVLLVAFTLALAVAARYASVVGLGQALRVGED